MGSLNKELEGANKARAEAQVAAAEKGGSLAKELQAATKEAADANALVAKLRKELDVRTAWACNSLVCKAPCCSGFREGMAFGVVHRRLKGTASAHCPQAANGKLAAAEKKAADAEKAAAEATAAVAGLKKDLKARSHFRFVGLFTVPQAGSSTHFYLATGRRQIASHSAASSV